MNAPVRPKFGSVEVASADIVSDSTLLQFELLHGVMNKHEVGMLILFLQDKQKQMKDVVKPAN